MLEATLHAPRVLSERKSRNLLLHPTYVGECEFRVAVMFSVLRYFVSTSLIRKSQDSQVETLFPHAVCSKRCHLVPSRICLMSKLSAGCLRS